jgi:hypothetical protein
MVIRIMFDTRDYWVFRLCPSAHYSLEDTSSNNTIRKLRGLSPRANYTDRATTACRKNYSQLMRIRLPLDQRDGFLRPYSRISRSEPLLLLRSSSSVVLTRLGGQRSRPTTSQKMNIWKLILCFGFMDSISSIGLFVCLLLFALPFLL